MDVPEKIRLDISVHKIHGNEVMIIEEGAFYQGLIEKNADLDVLEAGEYYLKINSDKQEITRKFVLV